MRKVVKTGHIHTHIKTKKSTFAQTRGGSAYKASHLGKRREMGVKGFRLNPDGVKGGVAWLALEQN